MGQITGNENSFPTIKQVNDALIDVNSALPIVEFNDILLPFSGIESFGNIVHYRATASQSQIVGHVIDSSNVVETLPNNFLCTINNIKNITGIENTTLLFVKQNIKTTDIAAPSLFTALYTCSGVNSNGTYFTINLNIFDGSFSNLIIDYFILQKIDNPSSGGNTELDISQYMSELFELANTEPNNDNNSIGNNEYQTLTNPNIIKMLEEIIKVKPTILKGKEVVVNEGTNVNIEFATSNIRWGITSSLNENLVNQIIISFSIYMIYLGLSYHFAFYKMLDNYDYSKHVVDANGF